MAQAPATAKEEEPRRTHIFNEFGGCYTRSSRFTIPPDRLYNCENAMPIGPGNIAIVPNISAMLVDYGADLIYWSQYANVGGSDYLVSFSLSGKVFAYNIASGVSSQINAGTPMTGANARMAQWKRQILLFVDSAGYYYWDGTTFAKLTGTGVPSSGDDIAVCFGRVFILQGRLLVLSGADGFGGGAPVIPDATNYWLAANGSAAINLTDPTIRSAVTRLSAQNGYLYLLSGSGINSISGVTVPSGAVPPTPQLDNTNVQAIIGSDQPASVMPYDRLMMFANRYGVYALYGVSAERLSTDIDGTWKYVDFRQAISAGPVVVNNILCAAFLIKRNADPVFGSNTVVALWFDQKWWFANFGALTFIVSGMLNNAWALFGFLGNKLYQLFGDPTTGPSVNIQTALIPLEDSLADKQIIRAGFEVAVQNITGAFSFTADSQTGSNPMPVTANTFTGNWVNAAGTQGQWVNQAGVSGSWFPPAYQLYSGEPPGVFGKYVGFTLGSNGAVFQLAAVDMDYKLRARWTG
jgi:hypothetical protein